MSALSTFVDLADVPFMDDSDDLYDRCPTCQSVRVERRTVYGLQWNGCDADVTWFECAGCGAQWGD